MFRLPHRIVKRLLCRSCIQLVGAWMHVFLFVLFPFFAWSRITCFCPSDIANSSFCKRVCFSTRWLMEKCFSCFFCLLFCLFFSNVHVCSVCLWLWTKSPPPGQPRAFLLPAQWGPLLSPVLAAGVAVAQRGVAARHRSFGAGGTTGGPT